MNNLNLLESLTTMATVDLTDKTAVDKMEAKAKWKSCVISKPDHTLYLIQYLSTQTDVLRDNEADYTAGMDFPRSCRMTLILTRLPKLAKLPSISPTRYRRR